MLYVVGEPIQALPFHVSPIVQTSLFPHMIDNIYHLDWNNMDIMQDITVRLDHIDMLLW
jgi:hypothetical protein